MIVRWSNARHPRAYLAGAPPPAQRVLGAQDRTFEFFLNGFRLREGFRADEYEARTGLPWNAVEARIAALVERGLLEARDRRIRPSALGWRFVNDLQAAFLPEREKPVN